MSTTNIKINSLRTEYDFLRPCTDTSLISLDNSTLSSQLNNQITLEGALDYLSRIYAHWWKRENRVPVYGEKLTSIGKSSTYLSDVILTKNNVSVERENYETWQGADSITINPNSGKISLQSITTYSERYGWNGSSETSPRANYVCFNNRIFTADESCTSKIQIKVDYDRTPTNSTVTYYIYSYRASRYTPTISEVTSQQVSYTSTWDYIFSFERNAYPDSRTSGQYTYTYLGIPFENARGGLT